MLFCFRARSASAWSSGLSSTSRIVALAIVPSLVPQSEVECRSVLQRALGPHPATMAADNALDRCQSDSRALELLRPVKPLEGAKQFVGVCHIEAGAVVPDEIDQLPFLVGDTELDRGL